MFVPRALRLKGVQEAQQSKVAKVSPPGRPAKQPQHGRSNPDDVLVDAMQNTTTNSPAPEPIQTDAKHVERGPRFTVKPITPEYLAQLAAGIELIFTDYAHQEKERAEWFNMRYRIVDGEEKFIHLTAILQHPYISSLKPEASQKLLQEALQANQSTIIESSSNGYYVRRKPASYPPKFLPENSFEHCDDDGLTFWDQRTIYVEPNSRNMCSTPAKVAHWLSAHGQLRPKWLPIQAVHTLWNSCAFVVLSGNIMHEDTWSKWRMLEKPDDWKIMTKVEHTERTAEYIALIKQQNPGGMRKNDVSNADLPPIARPAALPLDTKCVTECSANTDKPTGKRKRKRKKSNKNGHDSEHAEADGSGHIAEEPQAENPHCKRRA